MGFNSEQLADNRNRCRSGGKSEVRNWRVGGAGIVANRNNLDRVFSIIYGDSGFCVCCEPEGQIHA